MIVLLDIDSTISDGSVREEEMDGTPEGWERFLAPERVIKDTLIPRSKYCVDLLKKMGWKLIFLTGRGERLREVTKLWLLRNLDVKVKDEDLIMRPLKMDGVPPTKYKGPFLKKLRKNNPKSAILAFDDDKYMAKIYPKYNILFFYAPKCWETLFSVFSGLPPEVAYRK